MKNSEELISDLIAPTIQALELELWGVEHIKQGKHSVLRVYINHADGIDVDDCARVSKQISSLLDVEDPISGEYNLEVSSPGAERPLFTIDQYAQFVGEQISLRLHTPVEGRRKFKGSIIKVEEDNIHLQLDGNEIVLPISAVDKANIVF